MTSSGISCYSVVYDNGHVVGDMGEAGTETEWDGIIDPTTVICATGLKLSDQQLLAISELGGKFSQTTTSKMSILVSSLAGVNESEKTKDANERCVPIISMARLDEVLFKVSARTL